MGFTRYLQMAIAVTAATMALAAPAYPTNTGFQGIGTDNATCVTGLPAVPRDNNGSFPIIYYGNAKPIGVPENYILNKTWATENRLGRRQVEDEAMWSDLPYIAMKAQYACNANDACVSFTVDMKENIYFHEKLIDRSNFIPATPDDTMDYGNYNKLCNPPPPTGPVTRRAPHSPSGPGTYPTGI